MSNAAVAAISVALYILLAPGVGGLLQGVDRKATARMQGRQGPPLLQSFYDVGKLLGKETKYMNHIQIVCHVSFLIFVIFTGALFFGGGDLLLIFFALTTANLCLILAATTCNSPYAAMGANREMLQTMAYEPMVLLTAVGFYLATGSFKVRGAYYKISQLSEEESAKGVIACSAGNHAQGVALAATRRGIRSIVCMPDGAPLMKVENTKNLGAEVCLVPGTYDEAHDKAVQLQKEYDMTFIHPYDDEQVIAGQGTIGLEILDQLPDVDAVVVPVGGGGLISGIAFAIKTLRPEVKVYGVQAEGAPSMYRSLHEHKYQTLKAASTFADGIQVKTPGELTYQLCEQYVDDIVTVTEDETAAAILSLMENQKLVAEGAGAVPVAAVLFHKLPVEGKKVACVISGGNIDVNILNRVITRGLVMSGRKANLTIALEDKPGQLKKVAEVVSRCGSNVVSVQHDGSDPNMPISSCFLKLTLETRDAAQIEQIRTELTKAGFQLVSERV